MRWWAVWVLGTSLACSGLLGGQEAALLREAELDAADEAEQRRLQGDFDGAEAVLRRRLAADPQDARGWRLLGDVNLTRGQRYQQRWKENLGWALEAYEKSVKLDPSNCMAWGRLSASVLSAAENDEVRVSRERLSALPLEKGWAACGGPVMLQLELERVPTEAELAAARVPDDAGALQRVAAAAPHMPAAVQRLDLSALAWESRLAWPDPAAGKPFVVLEVPTTGAAVEGSEPRTFSYPEWVTVTRRAGDRLVYPDRRFAAQVPQKAVTQATGCPGTTWTREGAERLPKGKCVAGPQSRSGSPIYDPQILEAASVAHYHVHSIQPAIIPWEKVADKTVRCTGGPVGRLFVEVPACQVTYDEPIPQTRSLAVSSGRAAWSEEHARRMVDAARGGALLGEPNAARLARGEVAVGLPYGLYVWSQPELTGCKGRGVFSKLRIVDGALEFDCAVGETQYTFRELAITQMGAAPLP